MIHECQSNITDTCCLFTRLGFVIHSVKSVLGPVETQFEGGFVLISLSTTVLAVCLYLSELQCWFHNIEKADLFPLYPKCKDLHNPVQYASHKG